MYLEYKGEKRYIYVAEKDYYSKEFILPLNAQQLQYAIANFAEQYKILNMENIKVEINCPEAYASDQHEKIILTYSKEKNKQEIEDNISKRVEELKKEIDETLELHIKEYTKCLDRLLDSAKKDNIKISKV